MASDFDPGAGGLLGGNDLQSSIDALNNSIGTLTTAIEGISGIGGMSTSPVNASQAEGATISHNVGMGAVQARFLGGVAGLTASQTRGGVLLGQGGNGGQGGGSGPTLNQMASGGGANGGGSTGLSGAPQGSLPYSGYSSPAGPRLPNGNMSYGSSGGGGGGIITGSGTSSPGASFAQTAVQAGMTVTGMMANAGMSQLSNQLLFNAYGTQMQAQWGGSAQAYQNQAFGNGINGYNNYAAAGNAQAAAQEFGTLTQLAGGANVTSTAAFQATNALALTNQGLGAAGASQLAAQIYNPQSSLMMQLLTGVSAYNAKGGQNSLTSIIGGLASAGYLGGGSYNARTGTFKQSALNASFTPGRGTSYMNLQSLGYNASQIQDIQSMLSQANQIATSGHTSLQNVLNTMNAAEYNKGAGSSEALGQLHKWDPTFKLSTLQNQGNLAAVNLGQQQSQSSTYNDAVNGFTNAMNKATTAVNWFLDKTGLNKVLGGVQGGTTGYQTSGLSGWVSGIGSLLGDATRAVLGGGAASVSVTQPMTSGSRPGSSMSSGVPSQVQTAVKDAEREVGTPYVYGGDSPSTGFDCSGLVMWAYGQAGVKLPRTSEEQWSYLKNRSVPLTQVREGDIVFAAGSDGTANNPGHEALMISSNQIVEAPYTGADIRIRAYNPGEWSHAGRPVGSTSGSTGASTSVSGTERGYAGGAQFAGNTGGNGDSALGLTTNADSMLFGGAANGAGVAPGGMTSAASNGSATSSGSGSTDVSTAGGGNEAQNKALAKKMAQEMYNWTGAQWSEGLLPLWTQESGFNNTAQNPTSTAYGIAQFLDSTWAAYGPKTSNPGLQIKYGLEYIKSRYGTPIAAEQHEKAYNWYGTGGPIIVGDRGPEMFVPSQSGTVMSAKDTANLLRGNAASPAQSPYTASAAQSLLLDVLSPANDAMRSGTGGVQVSIGTISVNAPNMTGTSTTSDVQVLGQLIVAQVKEAMQRDNLISNIAQGNT